MRSSENIINVMESVFIIYEKNTIWKLPQKTKVFGFVGTDHLKTKNIINDETLEQVNQFTYLGCSISYQFSKDVETKLAKFLQLIGTIKRTIFRKVRTETIWKIHNTLIVPIFLYGSENWTVTASHYVINNITTNITCMQVPCSSHQQSLCPYKGPPS